MRPREREIHKFSFSPIYECHWLHSWRSANSFCGLFCSPKSSMENPSLRVSGHSGSTNRTFIVEDYPEDECGQSATDEATGEQSRHVKIPSVVTCVAFQLSLVPCSLRCRASSILCYVFRHEERAQDPEWWSEEDSVWWSKKEARKALRKVKTTSLRMMSVPIIQRKLQIMNTPRTKEEARIRKEKARKVPILNQNSQPQKHLVKKDMVISGNLTIGIPVYLMIPQIQPQEELLNGMARDTLGSNTFEPCQPSDTRCSGSWLHTVNWIKSGNQKVPETCVVLWHYDRVLPLPQVLRVCQLWDGDLLGKLRYPFSDNTSVFNQSWRSWNC